MMGSAQGERKKVIEVKIQLPPRAEEEGQDIPARVALQQAAAHLQMMELAFANGDVNGGWDWFKHAADAAKKGIKKVKDGVAGRGSHPEVVTVNLPKQFVDDTHELAKMFDKLLTIVEVMANTFQTPDTSADQVQEKRLGEIAQGVYRPRARQG